MSDLGIVCAFSNSLDLQKESVFYLYFSVFKLVAIFGLIVVFFDSQNCIFKIKTLLKLRKYTNIATPNINT